MMSISNIYNVAKMEKILFDLHQLRAFITVIDAGSFSAAARQLNQTQSAISQLILQLEKSLNCQLIDRRTRPVRATLLGHECYKFSIKILAECKQMQNWLHVIESGKLPLLRLGLVDSVVAVAGLQILKYLQPKVDKIHQITGTAPELLTALQAGKLDIIITMINGDVPDSLSLYPLITEKFFAVTPNDWPEQTIEQLCKHHNYIAYSHQTPTGTQTQNWLKWRNLRPNIQFELARADHILSMIASGHGWTLATPMFLANDFSLLSKLNCSQALYPGLTRKVAILCRHGVLENFIPALLTDVKEILDATIYQRMAERWPWMYQEPI
ncbi:LysR family transcriptional regulator [Budvicia aquatica]|uniref:LysR family transcriptional regulator n=3 Tax=Budvicia aquatica TaxID=82979 RepID=A0A2C6DQD5_9GAMM|nr:LysR family transcriptional regulator [Budvicia aquatica]